MLIKRFGDVKLHNHKELHSYNERFRYKTLTDENEKIIDLTVCPSKEQYDRIDNMYEAETTSKFLKRFFYKGDVEGQTPESFSKKNILLSEKPSTVEELLTDTWFNLLSKTGGSRTKLTRKRVLRNKNTRKKRKYKKRRITNKKNKRSRIKK